MTKISLVAAGHHQLKAASTASSGRSSKTVYGGHEHSLRQTLIALTADQQLHEHDNPSEATLYVLSGRVRLNAGALNWDGQAGDLIEVPKQRHSLLALHDAVLLLTVVKEVELAPLVSSLHPAAVGGPTSTTSPSRAPTRYGELDGWVSP